MVAKFYISDHASNDSGTKFGELRTVGVRNNNGKFIAAYACDNVRWVDTFQPISNVLNHAVPNGVAIGVIDVFEIIDIKHNERVSLIVVLDSAKRSVQTFVEQQSIGNAS